MRHPASRIIQVCSALACLFCIALGSASRAQYFQTRIHNPQHGHDASELGFSIALDGNLMIVGAHASSVFRKSSAGLARIYRSNGSGGWTFEAELTADNGAFGDSFGISVAISGEAALVGAHQTNNAGLDAGSAYVFVRSGGSWIQEARLTASDAGPGDNFGFAVALSGNTAVVGAYRDDTSMTQSGSAYVFSRSASGWSQQQKIVALDPGASDEFGGAVAINNDTVIVGASRDDDKGTDSGSAYIFKRAAGTWSQQAKLTDAAGQPGDRFGGSVAIAGSTAVVGAFLGDGSVPNSGSVCLYELSAAVWTQQPTLTAFDGAANDRFGYAVSLSGTTLAVSAYADDDGGSNSGSVYVFNRAGAIWNQQPKLTASDAAAGISFGRSVSISGNLLAIGSHTSYPGIIASGSAYVFARPSSSWTQQSKLLAATATANDDFFGSSVAISGNTVVIGADQDRDGGENAGSVYFYARIYGLWTQLAKFIATDLAAKHRFGSVVDISGDSAIVASPLDDGAVGSGAAYVFNRAAGGVWSHQARLIPLDDVIDKGFGRAVAIEGDVAVVSATGMNDGRGAVYVFIRSGNSWAQYAKLTASNGKSGDAFGIGLSISGNTLLVGSHSARAAYVFVRSGSVWTQQAILTYPGAGGTFGRSVAISENTALVGEFLESQSANSSGAAFVFTRSGATWTQQTKLKSPAPETNDQFGFSLALEGDVAMIGACNHESFFISKGFACIFKRSGTTWTFESILAGSDSTQFDQYANSVTFTGKIFLVGARADDGPETRSGSVYVFSPELSAEDWMFYP